METNGEKRTIAWGIKKESGCEQNGDQFYESFMLDGIEYFLYDNVYLYKDCDTETSIGKLLRIFETPTHEKIVEVLWFLRPMNIRTCLGDYQPKWNELFLASGADIGLSNQNSPDAIIRKCNVVCASRDRGNQATEQELRVADYIFFHSFDVGKCTILENFPDEIGGVEVKHLLNNGRDHVQENTQTLSHMPKVKGLIGKSGVSCNVDGCRVNDAKSDGGSRLMVQEAKDVAVSGEKEARIPSEHPISGLGIGVNSVRISQAVDTPIKASSLGSQSPYFSSMPHKKRRIPTDVKESNISKESAGNTVEVTKRQALDKSKWFKQPPWKERLTRADEDGKLVLLRNLDPSCTSSEVKDLVWHAFRLRVDAKMIQRSTFTSPHYGEALVIFDSVEAAEMSIRKLEKGCLMLADGRPLVGTRGHLKRNGKQVPIFGHLEIDGRKHKRPPAETVKAISTSHCSQPNTIEYEMAIEWCLHQEKSDIWWEKLHKKQGLEIEKLSSQLSLNSKN